MAEPGILNACDARVRHPSSPFMGPRGWAGIITFPGLGQLDRESMVQRSRRTPSWDHQRFGFHFFKVNARRSGKAMRSVLEACDKILKVVPEEIRKELDKWRSDQFIELPESNRHQWVDLRNFLSKYFPETASELKDWQHQVMAIFKGDETEAPNLDPEPSRLYYVGSWAGNAGLTLACNECRCKTDRGLQISVFDSEVYLCEGCGIEMMKTTSEKLLDLEQKKEVDEVVFNEQVNREFTVHQAAENLEAMVDTTVDYQNASPQCIEDMWTLAQAFLKGRG